ncbi:methyl-accepting chemotaxis protein [Natrinema hispanicum]|uniref:Methyl-accepting chemotaxis protein n=1 Tax=Natrinema hispanicum TaxID=392421 RepID=A0A1I0GN97_9EURY|nr:methyl-accepting chemotaxis protein [Natrinema hispanicum]SDC99042.1 methyl-accepting chemotaxis protein [Natrinema hispanicum]SET72497.1 methyl-accepting chemotaxis protein [Natrinema hispanicum]
MGLNPWEHIPVVRRRYALRFLAALAVILLIVGAFGGTIYAQTGDELESDVESQLVTSAETDADRIDIWFRSTERYLSSLPRSSAFRSDDRVAISDSLHRMNDRTAFEGAYYVDAETGAIHANAGTNAVITDDGRVTEAVDAQLSTVLKDDSQVVFSEAFETEAGRPAMLAVSDVPGESDHVVVGVVDLESLSRYMIGADDHDDVVVVDRSGTIVLAEERSLLLQDDALEPETVANGTGTTSIDAGSADSETVVGYAPLEHDGWTLTTRVPAADAYALQSTISNWLLAMLAVTFGGMLVLGATVGRNTARSLRDLSERAAAIEDGNLDDPLESPRSDELGELHRSIDQMRQSLRDRLEEAEAARAEAERERSESERFSRQLEQTADEYGTTMRACADGDLTRRLDLDADSEAMATVAAAFNDMMDDLEATVAATRAFADAVDEAADSTADGVVEVRSASEQVTTSVQQIADGAERQSDHLETISDEVDELSTTTQQIAATSSQVATLAEQTATTSADARESARRAIAGMNAIEEEASDAVAEVARLEEEIAAIDDLLEFIADVTRETNMLALNASIEAARSSSDDAQFTAVAEQVKSLAADTQEAATDIEARLEQVSEQTAQVAAVVRQTDERIADHRSAVETTVASLEEISTFAEETNEGVQEISAATQQQAGATQGIVTMTDDVTAISEETSAEAETVAAAAEEQTSSLVAVSHTATSLSEQARELSDALSAFEVNAELAGPEAIESETLAPNAELPAADDYVVDSTVPDDASTDDYGDTTAADEDEPASPSREFDWTSPQ